MRETIERILLEITENKKQKKIEPSYALRRELMVELEKETYRILKNMRDEGRIDRGETISDYWIEIKKP